MCSVIARMILIAAVSTCAFLSGCDARQTGSSPGVEKDAGKEAKDKGTAPAPRDPLKEGY